MLQWLNEVLRSGIGAAVAFVVGWALAELRNWYRIRQMRKRLEQLAGERSAAEAVFIISNREDIRPSVQRYLEQQQKQHLAIFQVHRPELFSDDMEEWHKFLDSVRKEVQQLRQYGPTRVLLFTNVPVAMGISLGALLDNGPEVVIHHYFNGMYRPVARLAQETIKP